MCTVSPENSLMSVEEVALELGTTPLNILLYIKRGQLQGQEIEGKWFVASESLSALKATSDSVGSAPCKSSCGHGGGCGGGCH
ncbi:hypothetical protein Pcar_1359 [Syntrophotalea carbinolica DSM 2380]|uniref:Helix-turn-helix domain-containing protein n=1 Tax=Syntrophotalea carbinolica (strain DSM 2380 / NBRC 103641 / GraBd1) TaxID=338963 RepID=Q3A4V0_SYNC1|nr:hypothetical protein [Syntrophotalea carbinolica]ABA88607.2 hypothetical protein Pcar_1359 [Syntrophotalea carbinolica DSM 2380]